MLTNRANLPESIVRAIRNDPYKGGGDISVTSLIKPPQMRYLQKQYGDRIEEDASDRIWSLIGQAVHSVLERIDDGSLKEQRLYMNIEGWSLSGQLDRYLNGSLIDYKITSVWSVKQGIKREWEEQLNILAALCRENNLPVKNMGVVAILRDWRKNEALQYPDYPETQIVTMPIPLWESERTIEFIRTRVRLHQEADKGNILPCSNEERWYRDEKFAVMKDGRKKALKLEDTESRALEWAHENDFSKEGELKKGVSIVHRQGTYTRCEQYCNVSKFCSQFKGQS